MNRSHPQLETFNSSIGHNQSAFIIDKNKIYFRIKAASNWQGDPNAITAAVCWKDDIVILQHPTVRSASEVSLLHWATSPQRSQCSPSKRAHLVGPRSPLAFNVARSSNPLTLFSVNDGSEILGSEYADGMS